MLLPYVDQAPLYNQINFNINACCDAGGSPQGTNDPLLQSKKLAAFLCPSDSPPISTLAPNNYAVCNGSNQGWTWANEAAAWGDGSHAAAQNGVFNRQAVVNISGVRDGTSNTIAMSEIIVTDQGGSAGSQSELSRVRDGGGGIKDEWAAPWAYPQITKANVQAWQTACAAVTTINGNRVGEKWYHGQPGRTAFNTFLTPNSKFPNCSFHCGGCHFDGGGLYGARSQHVGGVHVLLTDGASKFISENIDWSTYQRLGSRNDGEPVGEF
jgi:hypothetical protein